MARRSLAPAASMRIRSSGQHPFRERIRRYRITGVQSADVHVYRETGQVKILHRAIASHCGTVRHYPFDLIGAEGQVESGLAQGIGYALTEGLQFDEGLPANLNLFDYRIPSMRDMPPLQYALADIST